MAGIQQQIKDNEQKDKEQLNQLENERRINKERHLQILQEERKR